METAWGVTQRVGKRRESLKRGLVGGGDHNDKEEAEGSSRL